MPHELDSVEEEEEEKLARAERLEDRHEHLGEVARWAPAPAEAVRGVGAGQVEVRLGTRISTRRGGLILRKWKQRRRRRRQTEEDAKEEEEGRPGCRAAEDA
ncbi:LOW QUALITY PROTEIN: hypothetical protein CVT25_014244 [Psilocybe cyanescens]|uniref:Uncharacterized protein n=1 Tax=Psilocybe cyanescens TaxID=93625 RepID=A0A409XJQ6_PSICY|nr:LOW QUALITY PROTEIN: hypothetical protein CVT25_014244 [Psilocybe cyanescens]